LVAGRGGGVQVEQAAAFDGDDTMMMM